MSTQSEDGLQVLYDREQQGVRLLELPQELVDLISSGQAPQLYMKSSPVDSDRSDAVGEPAYAVLCSESKTYQIRQVQTSNTVFITKLENFGDRSDKPSEASLCAFATCASTLEVLPQTPAVPGKTKSSTVWLRELLPVYHSRDDFNRPTTLLSKESLFGDLPFSKSECETAWTSEVAFEHHGIGWRPSAEVLLTMWKTLSESAAAEGYNLLQPVPISLIEVSLGELDVPAQLQEAFLDNVIHWQAVKGNDKASMNRKATMELTGMICAALNADTGSASTSQVLEAWKELLPDVWADELSTDDASKAQASIVTTSRAKQSVATPNDQNDNKRPSSDARNWHEKLKRPKH